MRRRRLRLALLAVALFGVVVWLIVAWLIWPTSSPVITAAKERYARLQLGMSASDVADVLGVPPEKDSPFYGVWVADLKWYRGDYAPDNREPAPHERLYDYRTWAFDDEDPSGNARQRLFIQTLFNQGRLVLLWSQESRENATTRRLEDLAERLSLNPAILKYFFLKEDRKAIPPR
jgi:hypothetical protein